MCSKKEHRVIGFDQCTVTLVIHWAGIRVSRISSSILILSEIVSPYTTISYTKKRKFLDII